MINDVFGGRTRSHNRFLVENIIVRGAALKRRQYSLRTVSAAAGAVITLP